MLWPLLALLLLPFSLAAKKSVHEQLVDLAAAGNGLIKLNEKTYDLLTSSKRDWSASVHFTALSPQRRCAPCKSVVELNHIYILQADHDINTGSLTHLSLL